jgi:hypothetical protein
LLALGLVQCGFEAQPFACLEGAGEVPLVTVQEVPQRGAQLWQRLVLRPIQAA